MSRKAIGSHYFAQTGYPVAAVKVLIGESKRVSHPHDLTEMEHDHDFRELVIVLRGKAMQRLQGESYAVKTGDVYILQESTRHYFYDIEELEIINIMYDNARLPLPLDQLRQMPGYSALFLLEPQYRRRHQFSSRLALAPPELEQARVLGEIMIRDARDNRPGRGVMLLSHLLEIMTFFARQYQRNRTSKGQELLRIGDVIGALERDFARGWTVDEMCRMARMSRRTFLRAFEKAIGSSPLEFLMTRRINAAERLLRESNLTITEIAFETGFYDSNYLARQFKKRKGISPSACRR